MPIQSDDIKLLKSAVMADVPEGGGAATGIAVVDGQSNNIFPDTSTDDRASGRVQLRKLFGAVHTDNTDTALGAHFAVLAPPEDPLVHVTIFETPGWSDERATAQETVERYMVKGPRLSCRIMDRHYAGSRLLQLYQVGGANFPAAGDAIALRNPNGAEQYVRLLKVTQSRGKFFAIESGNTTSFDANVAVCELGQPLAFDVLGPPIERAISEGTSYAIAYTTTVAAGAAFHGVKPLGAPAAVGDRAVVVDGGVYSPIVPAATVEEPLIDLAPLTRRQSLSRTGVATLTLPSKVMPLQPGTALRLPTAAQPGTVAVTSGTTTFTDDGNGSLLQGTVVVGSIDYRGKVITFLPASPSYANNTVTVAYMPATPAGAAVHSDSLLITSANQGLAFTAAFEPPPAPGTFTLSYMAQGRWYDLVDNGNGKLAGVDSSYGTGSINYASGSIAYTMGALPDVGSRVIYQWGDAAQAEAVALANRPGQIQATFSVPPTTLPQTLVISWQEGGQAKQATCNAAGTLSGDATGNLLYGVVSFRPSKVPDAGSVSVAYETAPVQQTASNNGGSGNYSTTFTPIVPGTVRVTVPVVPQSGYELPDTVFAYDDGAGILRSTTTGVDGAIGTVNYSTGAISIYPTVAANVYERVVQTYPSGSNTLFYEARVLRTAHTISLANSSAVINGYATGNPTVGAETPTLAWGVSVPVLKGLSLAVESMAFAVGTHVYTAAAGVLNRGWDIGLGTTTSAGSVTDSGVISITTPPAAGQTTAITWHNAAQSRAVGKVGQGVFRVETAPIKVGVFQIQAGSLVGAANNAGVISGDGWAGAVDWERGIVTWNRNYTFTGPVSWGTWQASSPVAADELTYNAVFLQYIPLDGTLLGLDTARLPLDGKVPVYHKGGQVIVHNTLTTALPSTPTRDLAYSLGRQRVAAVQVRSASGVLVPGDRYTVDFDAGTITIPAAADLTGIDQPMTVHHRIEDVLLVTEVDISGQIKLVSGLTHDYPAGTSYVSSKLRKGDLFARSFGYRERTTWAGSWQATAAATAQPTASYDETNYPIEVTNRGAITERWAVIFMTATTVRVVGEETGQVLTGVSITGVIEALNPQTNAPYFSIDPLGWGGGWAVGNVLLFETAACGSPVWVARTVLQGPATQASDSATLMFGCDVDA